MPAYKHKNNIYPGKFVTQLVRGERIYYGDLYEFVELNRKTPKTFEMILKIPESTTLVKRDVKETTVVGIVPAQNIVCDAKLQRLVPN